jgi:hypothetical protein
MIFTIPNESNNKTNSKKFSDLAGGYSIRFIGSYSDKPNNEVGYLFRRNLSTETLIIGDGKLHFQYRVGEQYFSNIVDEISHTFDFFINVDYNRNRFTYYTKDKIVNYDLNVDKESIVADSNYFTFLSDNIYEKTTDKNLLIGDLQKLVMYDRVLEEHEIKFNLGRTDIMEEDSLYANLDTNEKTNFKIFDNSGNGNHGLISEPVKFKHDKIMDFVGKSLSLIHI